MAIPSFQGVTTGIQTDKLVAAILAQEGAATQKLVNRQAYNVLRTGSLNSLRKGVDELATSLASLSSATDSATAMTNLQDVLAKYNTVAKAYKDASVSTRSSTGGITKGTLSDTSAIKNDLRQIQSALSSSFSGLGIATAGDGTLSLNTSEFQANYAADPIGSLSKIKMGATATQLLSGSFTATGSGDISLAVMTIEAQNTFLTSQIEQGQARLTRRETVLKAQFAKMETIIAQMKAAVGGLSSLGTTAIG